MTPSPIARAILAVTAGSFVVGLASAGFATQARAQNYPWCLLSSAYEGGENCGFTSYDQCQATRLGIGGFCQVNSQYQAGGSLVPSPRAHKAYPGRPS
jgi:hypothetical protein